MRSTLSIIFRKKLFNLIWKNTEFKPPELKKIKNSDNKFFSILYWGKYFLNFFSFLNNNCATAVFDNHGFVALNIFLFLLKILTFNFQPSSFSKTCASFKEKEVDDIQS